MVAVEDRSMGRHGDLALGQQPEFVKVRSAYAEGVCPRSYLRLLQGALALLDLGNRRRRRADCVPDLAHGMTGPSHPYQREQTTKELC